MGAPLLAHLSDRMHGGPGKSVVGASTDRKNTKSGSVAKKKLYRLGRCLPQWEKPHAPERGRSEKEMSKKTEIGSKGTRLDLFRRSWKRKAAATRIKTDPMEDEAAEVTCIKIR